MLLPFPHFSFASRFNWDLRASVVAPWLPSSQELVIVTTGIQTLRLEIEHIARLKVSY